MNKKVLITASTFSHITSFHLPYLSEFKKKGWEVHVACGGKETALPCTDKIYKLPLKKSLFSLGNFKTSHIIRRTVKENTYSLIICHTSLASFFTRLALKGMKDRSYTINVVHGYLFSENSGILKSVILQAAELMLRNQTDKILAMNKYDYEWAKRHKAAKNVHSIPGMGINEERICDISRKPKNDKDFVLTYLAEFSKRKNQEFLIKSMILLPDNFKLVLGGAGALREKCIALSKKLDLSDRISFLGFVTDIKAALTDADVAVSSSCSEGLPFNILEAMLSELPVVASKVKGHTDLIKDGVTGFLFDLDDPKGFAEAVMKLSNDREKALNMGKAGAQVAKQYVLDKVKTQVMNEYLTK